MKTRADLHRAIAGAYDMKEGTNLTIGQCFKYQGIKSNTCLSFHGDPNDYESCIAIVDGNKPVFKGDEIYDGNGCKFIARDCDGVNIYGARGGSDRVVCGIKLCSFSPKPIEVTVKLTRTDADYHANRSGSAQLDRLAKACEIALENK